MHKYILVCSSVQCTLERSIYVCPQSRTQDLYWSQNLICFPSLYFQELPLLLVFLFFWNFWVWDPAIIRHVHPYYGFSAFISKLLSTKVDWFSTNCNSLWNQNHPVCFCMCLFNSQPGPESKSRLATIKLREQTVNLGFWFPRLPNVNKLLLNLYNCPFE